MALFHSTRMGFTVVKGPNVELDYYNFEAPQQVGDVVVLKDMMHYTMVKTTMFNGVKHPSIAVRKKNGTIDTWRKFTYEDFKSRLG